MPITFAISSGSMAITNHLNNVSTQLQKSLERLSTGIRINSAADGPADVGVANTFEAQVRGYTVASSNIQQGLSMLGIADGALQQITGHLQNIRDIAVAASNSTNTASQFSSYQAQLTAELAAINGIGNNTKFNSNVLLDGSVAGGSAFNIQIGANSGDTLDIKTAFTDNTAGASGLNVVQTTLTTTANASTLLGQVDTALDTLNSNLALIGGFENRLTDQMNTLSISQTNVSSALATIRNTDVAKETSNVARLQILQSAGAYALAQANTSPQIAYQLLPH